MSQVSLPIPDAFFRSELKSQMGFDPLPPAGRYAVAQIFASLGWADRCRKFLSRAEELGLIVLAKRNSTVDFKMLWQFGMAVESQMIQIFLQGSGFLPEKFLENVETLAAEFRSPFCSGNRLGPFYLCSLSASSVSYQLPIPEINPKHFFLDLTK